MASKLAIPFMPQVRVAQCPSTTAPGPIGRAADVRHKDLDDAVMHARRLRELAETSNIKKGKSVVSDDELEAANTNVIRAEAALLARDKAAEQQAEGKQVMLKAPAEVIAVGEAK